MTRDEQIKFLEEADLRREEHARKWAANEEYRAALRRYDSEVSADPEPQRRYG